MHRNLLIYLSALSALSPLPSLSLRHGAHQLRDLYAYPKYEVQFMNDLPLSAGDAQRCKITGIGIEEDWMAMRPAGGSGGERRLINGDEGEGSSLNAQPDKLELVPMNFAHPEDEPGTPPYPYLCLMPSSNTTAAQTSRIDQLDEVEDELDPVQGWQALSHLEGKCLYSRQGWFTYAYCHNNYIRQFRQAHHKHPHPPGGVIPTEDPAYDAYTLGQANPSPRKGSSTKSKVKGVKGAPNAAKAEQQTTLNSLDQSSSISTGTDTGVGVGKGDITAPAVSFGLDASSRYLVQRWSDGTRCDKTGRPREVEVQVHCSMTTSDMIYMVKELAICQYVIIIHSPHLCGLPGFKAEHAQVEMAGIKCRQVISDEEFEKFEKGESEEEAERKKGVLGLPFSNKPIGEHEPQHRFGLDGQQQQSGPDGPGVPPVDETQSLGGSSDSTIDGTEIVFGLDVEDSNLREMLKKALESLSDRARGKSSSLDNDDEGTNRDEEIVLVSWDEDDEGGAVLIDADMVLMGGEEGEKKVGLGEKEKGMLERVIREYLGRSKQSKNDEDEDAQDEERVKDEL
ncbi:hypothetical protein CI109_106098 [Kwoniella shandongensis]|uniref:Protein OS-9 homolog n=1 Tax=Kwoniella shandongensis TaxID=1734106 RepID=A0A5M6BR85_9TREE|nr:uncharacterized protein CI109_006364 [Kwoniella shandongensis]KAA5525293.1 hypothetical protein CI109_006364 [Kwoniella shandongensis]